MLNSVAEYYNQNTEGFLKYGTSDAGAIRAAVWGEGVTDRAQAFDFVNQKLLEELLQQPLGREQKTVDLGCGVGQTLSFLQSHGFSNCQGVTFSKVQAQIASSLGRPVFESDFALEPLVDADSFLAIESLYHLSDPAGFAEKMNRSQADLFVICDFFANSKLSGSKTFDTFCSNWRVPSLQSVESWQNQLSSYELTRNEDWTPFLELFRWRDYAMRALVKLTPMIPKTSSWWGNVVGGVALQDLLSSGDLSYHFLVFRRGQRAH